MKLSLAKLIGLIQQFASAAFSGITSSTNTTAAMVVGTGSSLATSGSGTISATTATTAANVVAGTGTISLAGPTTARIVTFPDAAFTAARTDAAQTFTGAQTMGGTPNATGLSAAGTTSGPIVTNTANGDNCVSIIGNASHSGNLLQLFQLGTSTKPFYVTGSGIPVLNTAQFTGVNLINGNSEMQYVDSVLTSSTMTRSTKGIRTQFSTFAWTNAMVTALGATTTGNVQVCTLPARTIVKNVWILADNAAGGVTTMTVSVGRTGAAYVDYIPASTLNGITPVTIYGNTAGSRGANNNGFDLPSYNGGTTAVFAQFISTGANLSAATTCTGVVVIESAICP